MEFFELNWRQHIERTVPATLVVKQLDEFEDPIGKFVLWAAAVEDLRPVVAMVRRGKIGWRKL